MIEFTTTDQAARLNGCKILVYGGAGLGKTKLCSTAPDPFLISAEGGELSLANVSMPMTKIKNIDQLNEVYDWFASGGDGGRFKTICIDSLTEIAEVVLNKAKATVKDPRQAYGELIDKMEILIRGFRDLPGRNIYMSAKMEPSKDEMTGIIKYGPSMPGAKLGVKLPYYFDEVFHLAIGKTPDGTPFRFLRTQPDFQYDAKDRSGALDPMEPADLSHIIAKMTAFQPS